MKKGLLFLATLIFLGHWLHGQNAAGISLDGEWKLSYGPYDKYAPATPVELKAKNWPLISAIVPGNVELDLLAAGIIKNPEIGNHVYELRKYEAYQWWYFRTFETPRIGPGERVEIVFHGLDCLGTVWINDKLAGKTDNMLIDHRFDITGLLNPAGRNSIDIRIDPAVAEAHKYVNGDIGSRKFFRVEEEHIRKAPHMYGWDIMPRLISAGLWRNVGLEIIKTTRLEQIYWMTDDVDVAARKAQLLMDWQFSTDYITIDGLTMDVALQRGSQTIYENSCPLYTHAGRQRISLENVDFWWPRGYGDPVLYDARVRIVDDKKNILDEKKRIRGEDQKRSDRSWAR